MPHRNSIGEKPRKYRDGVGRPVSALTTDYLGWCCERLAAAGKTALLLVWDNAS